MSRCSAVCTAAAGLALWCGCGQSGPQPPEIDPVAAGQTAVAKYDANGDGQIDAREVEDCPGLKVAFDRVDRNGDKRLSADEVTARIETWLSCGTIVMDAGTLVTLNGRDLDGASVTFEPEGFLGPGFKTCEGVTNQFGRASVKGPDPAYPGAYLGFYRIRVSKKVGGQEIVPARYNAQSVLGYEVADDIPNVKGLIELNLTSP
jgi:hypothetical protein